MHIIRFNEEWDFHNELKIIAIENDRIVYSYTLSTTNNENELLLAAVYVQPNHRGKGYFKHIMEDAIDFFDSSEYNKLVILVRNDNFILEKYKKYDFVFDKNYDGYFDWYVLNKK